MDAEYGKKLAIGALESYEGDGLCPLCRGYASIGPLAKRKMQRESMLKEMKRRRFYEKPSDRATREKSEAIRRRRKLARKQAVRDGLIAAPPKKRIEGGKHRLA